MDSEKADTVDKKQRRPMQLTTAYVREATDVQRHYRHTNKISNVISGCDKHKKIIWSRKLHCSPNITGVVTCP